MGQKFFDVFYTLWFSGSNGSKYENGYFFYQTLWSGHIKTQLPVCSVHHPKLFFFPKWNFPMTLSYRLSAVGLLVGLPVRISLEGGKFHFHAPIHLFQKIGAHVVRIFNIWFTVWLTYKCVAYYTMQRFCNINFSDRMRWRASWGNESEWVSEWGRERVSYKHTNAFKKEFRFQFHDPIIEICKIGIHSL